MMVPCQDLYQRLEGPDARRRMVLCLRAQGRLAEAEELCNSKEPLDLSLKAMILEEIGAWRCVFSFISLKIWS